jgi:hypothetical protein
MSPSALNGVTNFGDLALMLPLAAVVLLWLLVLRAKTGALWWIGAVVFCGGGTALLKVYFFACPPTPDLHSPGGHTASARWSMARSVWVCRVLINPK